MVDTPTSEVLYRAADLIDERGWAKGKGWGGDDVVGVCLEGALSTVMGANEDAYSQNKTANLCPAGEAVRSYLSIKRRWPHQSLWIWNDEIAESGEAVVEVLRAAAVIEAAKEHAEAREPVSS